MASATIKHSSIVAAPNRKSPSTQARRPPSALSVTSSVSVLSRAAVSVHEPASRASISRFLRPSVASTTGSVLHMGRVSCVSSAYTGSHRCCNSLNAAVAVLHSPNRRPPCRKAVVPSPPSSTKQLNDWAPTLGSRPTSVASTSRVPAPAVGADGMRIRRMCSASHGRM